MNRRSLFKGLLAGAMLAVAPILAPARVKLSGMNRDRMLNHRWVEPEGLRAFEDEAPTFYKGRRVWYMSRLEKDPIRWDDGPS